MDQCTQGLSLGDALNYFTHNLGDAAEFLAGRLTENLLAE